MTVVGAGRIEQSQRAAEFLVGRAFSVRRLDEKDEGSIEGRLRRVRISGAVAQDSLAAIPARGVHPVLHAALDGVYEGVDAAHGVGSLPWHRAADIFHAVGQGSIGAVVGRAILGARVIWRSPLVADGNHAPVEGDDDLHQ
jgi:hypothetical protein